MEIINLTSAWNDFVGKGFVKNIFTDKQGRKVEAGARLGKNGAEPYAIDADTKQDVCQPPQFIQLANKMEILFNHAGALKPHTPPVGAGRQPDLPTSVTDCTLKCQEANNPLSVLNREFLVEVAVANKRWRAYPNVAPWEARGVAIWLVCVTEQNKVSLPHTTQALNFEDVEDFLEIAKACQGWITFFNSLHAGASANHLHFQSVYLDHKLAVESAPTVKMGEYNFLKDYPASGLVFPKNVSAEELWQAIKKIQNSSYPFNLIALASKIYLFVRNIQNEALPEFPGRVFSGINLAGLFISTDPEELKRVNEQVISTAYAKMTVGGEELGRLLG